MELQPILQTPKDARATLYANCGSGQAVPASSNCRLQSPATMARPGDSTVDTSNSFSRSKAPVSGTSFFVNAAKEQLHESESSQDQGRGARFNEVVNVVYYDSKLSHGEGAREEASSFEFSTARNEVPRDIELSLCASSGELDDHVAEQQSLSLRLGTQPFLGQRLTGDGDGDSSSGMHVLEFDIEASGNTFRGCRHFPKWLKLNIAYITAINRESSFGGCGSYHVLHQRFKSFRPLMFKWKKTEAEYADFTSRMMPFHVSMGAFFLTFFFVVHFLTLRNSIPDMAGLVIGEFVVSVVLVFSMVTVCFLYCFRRILELAIIVIIALLFSFRASIRLSITAKSIDSGGFGTLGFFAYNMMGFSETLLLLLIPYHLASIRYAFCVWLTGLTFLWIIPIMGLSAKAVVDTHDNQDAGYVYWASVIYALMACLVIALDQSCLMHERKARMIFWKLKTSHDRLELLEDEVFQKKKRKPIHVASTPLEGVIHHLNLMQSVLYSAKSLDKERENLQELLNEAKHNLTVTDNIYKFNAETCSDEFAKSYVHDLRGEGISKPRMLSRQTTLAVRRKSRMSGVMDSQGFTQAHKTTLSKIGVDWGFDCIAFGRVSRKPVYDVGYTILSPFCLSPDVCLNRDVLGTFLDEVSNHYLDNPYHNALHGATVCHMTLCLLEMLNVREFMSDLEDVSASIAALCHDVGHPGRNNNFMVAASTPLAITYNDCSVLENHHSSLTFRILNNFTALLDVASESLLLALLRPTCNIFDKVDPDSYRIIRKYVIEWILATDMKMHFDHISSFRTRRLNGEFNVASNGEDRCRVISMCIKAADVGHAATAWEQHEEWSRRVVIEFYAQGDEEERLGLPKSFLCDRSQHDKEFVPSQIGFINFVVKPLFEELKAVDDAMELSKEEGVEKVCIANLEANAAHWQKKEKGDGD